MTIKYLKWKQQLFHNILRKALKTSSLLGDDFSPSKAPNGDINIRVTFLP